MPSSRRENRRGPRRERRIGRDGRRRSSRREGSRSADLPGPEFVADAADLEDTEPHGPPIGDAYGGDRGVAAASAGLLQNDHLPAASGIADVTNGAKGDINFTPLRKGLMAWNAIVLLFSIVLLTEGVVLMYQAYDIRGALGKGTSHGTEVAATEGGLGVSVMMTGLLAFILGATQFTHCCHAECCAQMSYIIWSVFLVIYDFGVAFALVAVANWDRVQKSMKNSPHFNELAEIAVPPYGPGAQANLYFIVGILVASSIFQIVAVVLHVRRRTELANWFIADVLADPTIDAQSYGSHGSKNNARLAELRDYYAQLYAEHGLAVPSELRV